MIGPRAIPLVFMVVWIAALIVFEQWADHRYGHEATITGLVQFTALRFPLFETLIIGAGFGLILHLFHQGQPVP
jgi:hypothetical protein